MWTVGTIKENLLSRWKRKAYGGKKVNGRRERKTDMKLFKEPSIVVVVVRQRIKWRILTYRMLRKIQNCKLTGSRSLRDINTSGMKHWKRKTRNKTRRLEV